METDEQYILLLVLAWARRFGEDSLNDAVEGMSAEDRELVDRVLTQGAGL